MIVCNLSLESCDELAGIDAEFDHPSWSAATFKEQMLQPATRVYGCRVRGALIGFAAVHVIVDEAHILNLGLRKGFRRIGFGRKFLGSVLNILYSSGVFWVGLEVRQSNSNALKLYKEIGFKIVGVRHGYYRNNCEDAIVMKLDIRHFIYLFGASI